MFVLENEAIKQKKRQGVALSQGLLSTVLSCLNNVRPTGLATRPGNMVRVIDLALISSDEAPMIKCKVLICVVLISKNKYVSK